MPDRTTPAAKRIEPIIGRLNEAYPDARIALNFSSPLECVVATILSAQSTDVRVNLVTKDLFTKYRKPEDYLRVPEQELQVDIQSTGFFRQKTRSLRGLAQKLLDDFDGEVPQTISELVTLPGVARKTANVVQTACFPEMVALDPNSGLAVDTHVGRLAVRLGLSKHDSKEAVKIEQDLIQLVTEKHRARFSYLLIEHGRQICDAKKPACGQCTIEPLCPSSQEAELPDLFRTRAKKKPARKKPTAKSATPRRRAARRT